jgi:hypothetical protein
VNRERKNEEAERRQIRVRKREECEKKARAVVPVLGAHRASAMATLVAGPSRFGRSRSLAVRLRDQLRYFKRVLKDKTATLQKNNTKLNEQQMIESLTRLAEKHKDVQWDDSQRQETDRPSTSNDNDEVDDTNTNDDADAENDEDGEEVEQEEEEAEEEEEEEEGEIEDRSREQQTGAQNDRLRRSARPKCPRNFDQPWIQSEE